MSIMRGRQRGVRVADVVGVPVLPPARATAATTRLRALLSRFDRMVAPPPVRLLEGLFGVLDHAALVTICALDLPDLVDKPTTIAALALQTGTDPDDLDRLLRFAAARGWVRLDGKERIRSSRFLRFLRTDHPGGWRAWVEFAGGPEVTAAIGRLAVGLRTGATPFAAANGVGFFEWMEAHPESGARFDAAMAAGGQLHGVVLAQQVDWTRSNRVCDVGGGTGALLAVLLDRHRHLRGVLFDLPQTTARATCHERLEVSAGDFLAGVPSGCDTYLLVNVLHDWDDSVAGQVLTHIAAALPSDGRILIVEGERRARPLDDIAGRTDLLMLALTAGGRERSTADFAALATAAGLRLVASAALASGDLSHELRLPRMLPTLATQCSSQR